MGCDFKLFANQIAAVAHDLRQNLVEQNASRDIPVWLEDDAGHFSEEDRRLCSNDPAHNDAYFQDNLSALLQRPAVTTGGAGSASDL